MRTPDHTLLSALLLVTLAGAACVNEPHAQRADAAGEPWIDVSWIDVS